MKEMKDFQAHNQMKRLAQSNKNLQCQEQQEIEGTEKLANTSEKP